MYIREWEENKDGLVYVCKCYSDGRIEKHLKKGYEGAITNTEEAQLELQANIQYLVDLAEINMEG